MPVLLRATFFFKDDQDYGWSETLFSTLTDIAVCRDRARLLVPFRVACLGTGVSLAYVRVSDDYIKRDSLIYAVPERSSKQSGLLLGPSDIANTCLTIRLQASPLGRRTLSMRGIPDKEVANSGAYIPDADFNAALAAYFTQLTTQAWAIRSRVIPTPANKIANLVQNPVTGEITVSCQNAHGLTAGDPAVIRGCKGVSFVNGIWPVFSTIGPNAFSFRSNRILGTYLGGGTVAPLSYAVAPITSGQVIRASHRIAGRPFDSHRGRRSVVKRA